ncbi:hypothetical protein [Methanolapillus ohkumae]|uniref:Uncharacterized protein n=1 Tax=Methanolapillus ohkumae TaxID=3028298 RepID=A0AA96V692_9EURY|nr:hypothetical protein MsAm2_04690 [Methanosarcinaceae archaeon Am2]
MDLTYLSPFFLKTLHLSGNFFLTENSFLEQCRFSCGLSHLSELLDMAKNDSFPFETVLLTDFDRHPYPKKIGFALIDRHNLSPEKEYETGGDSLSDFGSADQAIETADILIFTPIVSPASQKKDFVTLLEKLFAYQNPMHFVSISQKDLAEDVIEYYSKSMLDLSQKSGCRMLDYDSVYSTRRVEKAKKTFLRMKQEAGIETKFGSKTPTKSGKNPEIEVPESIFPDVLEICCGNGMSTLALYEDDIYPLSIDINTEDICTGLSHTVLIPSKTIQMDAVRLSQCIAPESFGVVIGFMIGTIYEFNKNIWFSIAESALFVLKSGGFLFLTLRTEPEAVLISDYLKTCGMDGKIMDNRDNETEYDQWIYIGQKKSV